MNLHEKILHGFILACLLFAGFSKGLTFPLVLALAVLGGFHYRKDFLPVRQRVEESEVSKLKESLSILANEMQGLKTKMSGLAISSGFKLMAKTGARE